MNIAMFRELVLLVFLLQSSDAWWLFNSAKVAAPPTQVKDENGETTGEYLRNSPVPFEMSVAEQKFLVEAQRYMGDMSGLDQCHQIIITRLRKTCHGLGEEEVGKLAVALFNCQSKAEGRALYYCSEDMSLKDCTSGMDPDAWTAYHIISNRARSVCYATRHQQFRLKTEYLVNKLALTAGGQMDFLEKLKVGQENLRDATKGTLARLTSGHENLIQEQVRIRSEFNDVNKELTSKMTDNVVALNYEKRIIKEAEEQLTSMSQAIASTLENTTNELKKQDEKRKEEHAVVVNDLDEIKHKTLDTWEKIDEKTRAISERQDESLNHHVNIIENLNQLNDTLVFLLKSIQDFENRFDIRLSWFASQFGGTGDKLTTLTTCFFHFLYFILMTVVVLFLNAPAVSRLLVLIMVPFNAWAEIKLATSMSYITMTVLIFAVLAGHYVLEVTQRKALKAEEKNLTKSYVPAQNYVETIRLPAPEPIRPCTPSHTAGAYPFYTSYQATQVPRNDSWPIDFNHSSTPKPSTSRGLSPHPGSSPHRCSSITFDDALETENVKRQLNLTTDVSTSTTLTTTPSKRSLVASKRCGAQTKLGSACKRRISRTSIACEKHC